MFFLFLRTGKETYMIEIKDMSFSFDDKVIFDNVSVAMESGKFYGVIGQNGIGKTTFLKLISGQLNIKSGSILVDGTDLRGISRPEAAKKISVLSQEKFITDVSVYDYISSGRYPYHGAFGRFCKRDDDIIRDSANTVGVSNLLDRDIRSLSGGERQKVYIASVLAQDTPYIFLDEPTTYLDISTKFEIMSQLKKISKDGKGVIAVLHDISLALKYCDELLILENTSEIKAITPKIACNNGIIDRLFKVRCSRVEYEGKTEFIISER